MSRSRRRARVAVVVAVLAAAPLAGGCAAGNDAQTLKEFTVIDGVNADLGELRVRNVHVEAPPEGIYSEGGDAPVYGAVVNIGTSDDRLVGVSSSAAQSADLVTGPGSAAITNELRIRAGGLISLSPTGSHAVLRGLRRALRPGQPVPVTFEFANAGSLTVQAPIQLPAEASYAPLPETTG